MIVGRRRARQLLDGWADEAFGGSYRAVVVTGDEGMGKSTLVDHAVSGWASGRVRILAGHCQEDSSVPSLPVLAALGPLATGGLGDGGDSSLIRRTPESVVVLTDALVSEASQRPVVLRLDDLHWADSATLEFFAHLLMTVAHRAIVDPLSLLVVIGSRRPPAGSAAARFLDRLGRDDAARVLPLDPLTELEVNELLSALLEAPPSRRLLLDVAEVSEGNPLFVQTLVANLDRLGALAVEHGETVAQVAVTAEYAGADALVAARLDARTPAAQEVAATAAVLGDGERVDVLAGIVGLDDAAFDAALDELERADVLRERADGRYRFNHSAVRQHLVRSMSPRRRRARHAAVGRYLVDAAAHDGPTAPLQVAHHLRRGDVDARLQFDWELRATDRAMELGAWSRAARHAGAALDVLSRLPEEPVEAPRRRLLLAAATAHFRNHDANAAERAAREVVALAADAGDLETWGRGLLVLHRSLLTLGAAATDAETHDGLRAFIDRAGDAVPAIRAQCWGLLAEIAVSAGDLAAAEDSARRAATIGHELGDDVLVAEVEFARGLAKMGAFHLEAALAHYRRSEHHARAGGDEWILAWPVGRRGLVELCLGRLDDAETSLAEAEALCERTQHWAEGGLALALQAAASLARSDLSDAERRAEDALAVHRRSTFPFIARLAWPVLVYARALRQDRLGAADALDQWQAAGVGGSERFRVLVDALTLSEDDFTANLDADRYRPASTTTIHLFRSGMVEVDVELGCRLGDRSMLTGALEVLDELAARGTEALLPVGASVGRLRGMAMHCLGDHAGAEQLLARTGAELAGRGAAREAVRCDLERCIALADVGDPRAVELATEVAAALDATSSLALFQRLREHLPGLGATFRLHRTVVCWDIVESTQRLVSVGDEAFVDVLHDLDRLLRRRLDQHRGRAFKHTGDGIVAWFHDEGEALRCVRDVARDVVSWNRNDPDRAVALRAGVAAGEPVDDAGDLFGVAVVTAVRLCDQARGGEVALCTSDVVDVAPEAVAVRAKGALDLKGLDGPVTVYEVVIDEV